MVEDRIHCWWFNKTLLQRKHGQWCRKELFNWHSLNATALISREEHGSTSRIPTASSKVCWHFALCRVVSGCAECHNSQNRKCIWLVSICCKHTVNYLQTELGLEWWYKVFGMLAGAFTQSTSQLPQRLKKSCISFASLSFHLVSHCRSIKRAINRDSLWSHQTTWWMQ